MFDRLLACAGALAYRAHRIGNWFVVHPVAVVSVAFLWLALLARSWPLALMTPAALLFAGGGAEFDFHYAARARAIRGIADTPKPDDLDVALFAVVVGLVAFACVVPWPSESAAGLALITAVAIDAVILVGWQLGYVVFIEAPIPASPVAPPELALRDGCAADAFGMLMTRNVVHQVELQGQATLQVPAVSRAEVGDHGPTHLRGVRVAIVNMPCQGLGSVFGRQPRDRDLVLLGVDREIGLSLSSPSVSRVDAGTVTLPRGRRPALRLDTVAGPVVLAFTTERAQAVVARAIADL